MNISALARTSKGDELVLAVAADLSRRRGGLFLDEVAAEMTRRGSRYSESTVRTY